MKNRNGIIRGREWDGVKDKERGGEEIPEDKTVMGVEESTEDRNGRKKDDGIE